MADTNLTVIRGDYTKFLVTCQKEVDGVLTAYDITGATVFFTVKDSMERLDTEAAIQKTITSHFNPSEGKTYVELLPVDTYSLNLTPYYYDVQLKTTDTPAKVYTVVKGKFTVQADVTRRTT